MEERVYMVEFDIPFLTQEMMELIPEQRLCINEYMLTKKISTFSLAIDRSRLWAIFTVASEQELIELINSLPMTPFMKYIYTELMFHNMLQMVPNYSLN
jgi:hypothetical protein